MTDDEGQSHVEDQSVETTTEGKQGWARRLRSALLVGVLVGLLLVGWVIASMFQSPEQRAAEARPPEERAIVATVTRGELVDLLNIRADIGFASEDVIASPASVEGQVVTETFLEPGDEVQAGAAVVALNDRPVFILPGQFSFYRDIEPGMEGRDIEQLQTALETLGHSIPSHEVGRYGWATRQAVADLYEAAGFEQITVPDPDAAEEAETPAESSPTADEEVSSEATPPPSPTASTPPPQVGPVLPMSEVIVAEQLPARLVDLPDVGDRAGQGDGFVTVASGPLVARTEVDAAVAAKLEVGMSASLTPDGGSPVEATIGPMTSESSDSAPSEPSTSGPSEPATSGPSEPSTSASSAGGQEAAGGSQPSASSTPGAVVFTPAEPIPSDWLGENVHVEVRIQQVTGAELLVPESAVSSGTDGSQRVYVKRAVPGNPDQPEFDRVEVEVLGSLAGQVAIRPVEDGALAEGDEVRVE